MERETYFIVFFYLCSLNQEICPISCKICQDLSGPRKVSRIYRELKSIEQKDEDLETNSNEKREYVAMNLI